MAQDRDESVPVVNLFTQSLALFFGMVVGGATLATKYSGKLSTFKNLRNFSRNSPEAKSAAYAVTGYAFLFGSGICLVSAFVSGKLFIYRLGVSSVKKSF